MSFWIECRGRRAPVTLLLPDQPGSVSVDQHIIIAANRANETFSAPSIGSTKV